MPFNESIIDRIIIPVMNKEAARIIQKSKENASWSERIPNAIKQSAVTKDGGTYFIDLIIDASPDGPAPHAAAFEYGSGEYATRGNKGKYIIAPKDANYLAFDWQPQTVPWGSPKFFGVALESPESTAGRYFFHFVEHPGVEARPYMQPAIESEMGSLRGILSKAVRKIFRSAVPRVTIIDA